MNITELGVMQMLVVRIVGRNYAYRVDENAESFMNKYWFAKEHTGFIYTVLEDGRVLHLNPNSVQVVEEVEQYE